MGIRGHRIKGRVNYITSVEGKWSVGRKERLKIQERNYVLLSAYNILGIMLNILHIFLNFQRSIMK